MQVYIIMMLVSMAFGSLAQRAKATITSHGIRQEDKLLAYHVCGVLSALPFILVTCLRYRVGQDWDFIYEPYYYYVNHNIAEFSESGFNLLFRTFGLFTADATYVILFIGFVTMVLFFLAIYDQSLMIPLSIFLLLGTDKYFAALNQLRQMLAMSLFVYSLRYVDEEKPVKYLLLNLIGFMFHSSSLLYLPFYFLRYIRLDWKNAVRILVAIIFLTPVLRVVLPKLIVFTRFGRYISSENEGGFYLLGFAVTLLSTALHVYAMKRYDIHDRKFEFWTWMMLVSLCAMMLTGAIGQVKRLAEGLSIVQLFSLPYILKQEKDDRIWLVMLVSIVSILSSKMLWENWRNDDSWNGVLPYRTIFSR